ncbi:hypothetical protein J2Y63_003785 [Shinella sp. BE166]|uniref:hypothetical protein n=1 Tax=Shinella sp. BE166 TaxID=3373918 RepID=UPI003EB8844C
MIRTRIQNIGGAFPGRGAAPAMTRPLHLPRDERAKFERLNDPDAWPALATRDNPRQEEEEA